MVFSQVFLILFRHKRNRAGTMQQQQQFCLFSLLSFTSFHTDQRMLDTLQQQSQPFTCQQNSNILISHTSKQLTKAVLAYLFRPTMVSRCLHAHFQTQALLFSGLPIGELSRIENTT
jgi:hypothetical protein